VGGLVHVTKQTLDNPNSAYNEELDRRLQLAKDLQKQFKGGDRSVDQDRRDAWRSFFFWKDQYALSFRHPFAMTSHKSQGSTMRRVFVAAEELERFNKASLYVAVTRPTDQVVL
jgi:ATP-dependent exoDNAse (exonuclease V) alpha subunit